jgi:hypothetical protein
MIGRTARANDRNAGDHVAGLVEAQVEYAAWLESLPDNLRDSPLAEALQAICDLDLTDLQAIIPPRGFGRDGPNSPRGLHRWVRQPLDRHSASRGSPL